MAASKKAVEAVSKLLQPATRPDALVSHGQRVCRLYKKLIYDIKSKTGNQVVPFRTLAVKMRHQFDGNKDMDFDEAHKLLDWAEAEYLKKRYPLPFTYPYSPGGCAFDRHQPVPDWILDTWHPFEKAQYPKYFALRDKRKREYMERYEAKYGTSPV